MSKLIFLAWISKHVPQLVHYCMTSWWFQIYFNGHPYLEMIRFTNQLLYGLLQSICWANPYYPFTLLVACVIPSNLAHNFPKKTSPVPRSDSGPLGQYSWKCFENAPGPGPLPKKKPGQLLFAWQLYPPVIYLINICIHAPIFTFGNEILLAYVAIAQLHSNLPRAKTAWLLAKVAWLLANRQLFADETWKGSCCVDRL